MSICVAYNCNSRGSKKVPGLTFHRFPQNLILQEQWLKAIGRKHFQPTTSARLCSLHFSEDQFDRTRTDKVRLKDNVVPHVFQKYPPHVLKKELVPPKQSVDKTEENEPTKSSEYCKKSTFPKEEPNDTKIGNAERCRRYRERKKALSLQDDIQRISDNSAAAMETGADQTDDDNGQRKETSTQKKRRLEKARQKYKEKRASETQKDKEERRLKQKRLLETMTVEEREMRLERRRIAQARALERRNRLLQMLQHDSQAKSKRTTRSANEEKFMKDFNPDTSMRETRKMNRKIYNQTKKQTIYDSKGIHVATGVDMCDCLDLECPGCYFPCPKCASTKCGHECRANRRWMYERTEIEGTDIIIKNPLLKN